MKCNEVQDTAEESQAFLENGKSNTCLEMRLKTVNWMVISWIVSGILASTTLILLLREPAPSSFGRYESGFATDFGPSKDHSRLQRVRFWGGPRWYENGTGYALHNPDEPRYTGPPTPQIDEAWRGLIGGRYFSITEQEAIDTWGPTHGLSYNSSMGYRAGVDVLHTLHCVNLFRQVLDHEHYFSATNPVPEREHLDHCVDQIRQLLMCHADLTPIKVVYYPGYPREFVDSDQVHSCRDWKPIQKWMDERKKLTKTVMKSNWDRDHPSTIYV